jgi:hypothetical protein
MAIMKTALVFLVGSLLSIFALSAPPDGEGLNGDNEEIRWIDNDTYVNANKILMFVTNHGNFGRDLAGVFGYDYGTFYPYFSIEDMDGWPCRWPDQGCDCGI